MSVTAAAPDSTAERPLPVARQGVQWFLLVLLFAFPWLPGTQGYLGMGAQAATATLIAASLVLLTGWVGQISLGHAALVGIGGYATGWAAGGLGLVFPLSLPVAAACGAGAAALLGVVAMRVRGLYLAVATLIFSWAASQFLFRQPWVVDHGAIPSQAIGVEGGLPYLDFFSRRTFYVTAWIVTIAVLYALVNLRDSRTGRAMFAIRGSEMAAASLGMDVLRTKVLAFGLSGAIAGIAGNLLMVRDLAISPASFGFLESLLFLAIAVVGGLTSLAGAVTAGWLFAGMEELAFRSLTVNEYLSLASAVLLATVFRVYPGGLAALGAAGVTAWRRRTARQPVSAATAEDSDQPERDEAATIERDAPRPRLAARAVSAVGRGLVRVLTWPVRRWRQRRDRGASEPVATSPYLDLDLARTAALDDLLVDPTEASTNGQTVSADRHQQRIRARLIERGDAQAPDALTRLDRPALIEARNVTKRFGGLTAVNDATLTVREGEICGLIGPNGAGKTTLFNMIAGFHQPTEGTVHLYGQDVTNLPVHRRAQLGVARTFQIIQLFSQLTVFDNLLAATHLQNPTGFLQHMAVTEPALLAEAAARDRVEQVVDLLGLGDVARRPVAGLPFGTLRMVEVARTLVSGARVIMLDEPASGLDERETDQLTEILRVVRGIGATLLLIEHDVRMVTSVTDYMYVLDRGTMIADGPPAQIQEDPAVIASYLGGGPDADQGPAVVDGEPAQDDEHADADHDDGQLGDVAGDEAADPDRQAPAARRGRKATVRKVAARQKQAGSSQAAAAADEPAEVR